MHQPKKNNALTPIQTSAAGHATATVSLQLFSTTPFLAFHKHFTNPFNPCKVARALPLLERPDPGTGNESTINPNIDFSFAFAAADQSDVESIRGMVTRLV